MPLDHGKETIATTALDAVPNLIAKMPEDSPAPFLLAISATLLFIGLLGHLWTLAVIGLAGTLLALVVWLWPEGKLIQRDVRQHG
jgi:cytochrome c oxidase subunit 1/cytochrome c oxidase subunit I+III